MYILKKIVPFKLKICYLFMKIPTLKEIKDKLPKVSLPKPLKEDLSSLGDTVLFIASPPLYYGKKAFNKKFNEDSWYAKSRRATLSVVCSGIVCAMGSWVFDKVAILELDDHISYDRQEISYDFGKITYTQSHDHEVKNDSILLKGFLPFERPFFTGNYGVKDKWTEFKGNFNRQGLEFKIEGYLPMTTNFTNITAEKLYRNTRHTKVEDTGRAASYALGVKEIF